MCDIKQIVEFTHSVLLPVYMSNQEVCSEHYNMNTPGDALIYSADKRCRVLSTLHDLRPTQIANLHV